MIDEDHSLTTRAYLRLRADLIACKLAPGSRLNISQLQRAMGFSQAAVREALSRLVSEGLVEIERHAGFRATPVSITGFRELTAACAIVEMPCLRSAIRNGDLAWEGKLYATYHIASRVLERVIAGEDSLDAYVTHRQAFHEALLAPCDNPWLLGAWRVLYAQLVRYRQTFEFLARYEAELTDDFQAFMDAVVHRRIDDAERMWTANYDKISAFVESLNGAVPEPQKTSRPR